MSRNTNRFACCDYCGGLFAINIIDDHEAKCVEATVSNSRILETGSMRRLTNSVNSDSRKSSARHSPNSRRTSLRSATPGNRRASTGQFSPGSRQSTRQNPSRSPNAFQHRSPEPMREVSPKGMPPPSRSSNGGNTSRVSKSNLPSGSRPKTTTISSKRSRSLNSRQESENGENERVPRGMPGTRVCYICGQRFSKNSLEPHEKKCLQFWEIQTSQLPKMLQAQRPVKWAVPSVDGTVDENHLAKMSSASSREAQSIFCQKCKDPSVSLADAREHAQFCRGKKGNKLQKERMKQAEDEYKHGAGLFNTLY